MISKELFVTLTDQVLDLYEKVIVENLSYDKFCEEMEKIRNKHNISKLEMADYLRFINAHMRGDLDAE